MWVNDESALREPEFNMVYCILNLVNVEDDIICMYSVTNRIRSIFYHIKTTHHTNYTIQVRN